MSYGLPQNPDDLLKSERTLILTYMGEDDQVFLVSDSNGESLTFPKNRNVPQPHVDKPPQPLIPAFRLLALAFVGLAPAGLGALVFAPLAALWALLVLITRPSTRSDTIRVMVVWGIAALLVGIALPMSAQVLAHFNIKGRFP